MEHALLVVVSWQRSEHGYISLRYETCSVSCHRLMPMDRAWLFIPQVWNMLCQLTSSHDNGQSMVIYPSSMKYASCHRLRYETCSVSCHRLMPIDRAWLFIPQVWNMLCQLTSSHDNGLSMVIYPSCSVSHHRLMTTDVAWLFIP